MPRHQKDLTGNYPYADVLRRAMACQATTTCKSPAVYDVSLRNRIGVAGDWISMCARHAGEAIQHQHQRARTENWPSIEGVAM